MTIDRLFVLWAAPDTGARHVIGHLTRSAGAFRFWYERDLSRAMTSGFNLLPVFPEHRTEDSPYVARYLFTTFADRIPSPARTDTAALLRAWGVSNGDDQFEVLARSGGIRATDRIELAEYRSVEDDLSAPLEFRIAGGKYVPIEERASLVVGDPVELRREPGNEFDAAATIVAASTGRRAGYVPRQYSAIVGRLLDEGVAIDASTVRELLIPEEAGRWVVRASRRKD